MKLPRAASVLVDVVAAATACGEVEDAAAPTGPEGPAQHCSFAAVDFARYFDTVDELVGESDEVLMGTVTAERLGPVRRVAVDVKSQSRTLVIKVQEAFRGEPPPSVEVEAFGYDVGADGTKVSAACPVFEVGDRVVMALTVRGDERGASSAMSAYRLVGDRVADTERSEPLAREIEAMAEVELLTALRAAG